MIKTPFSVPKPDCTKLVSELGSPAAYSIDIENIMVAIFHLATEGPGSDDSTLHSEGSELPVIIVLDPIKPGVKPTVARCIAWSNKLLITFLRGKHAVRNGG